ncbi:MAG: hypothetical protein RL386_676, partial [Bacteroidota bacterium]
QGRTQPVNAINASNFEVRFLGISDGLSSRNINQIFEDKRGMIWAATEQGLDIFNGQRFQPFNSVLPDLPPLPGRIIHHLAEDEDQRVWISTSGGTVVLDTRRRNYLSLKATGIPENLSRSSNFTISSNPSGGLWIFSGKTLYAFKKKKGRFLLQKIAPNPYTSAYLPDIIGTKSGECWMLDKIHGLSRLEGHRFVKIKGEDFPYPINLYPKVTMTDHLGDSLTIFRDFQYSVFNILKTPKGDVAMRQEVGLREIDPRWRHILDYLAENPVIAGGNLVNISSISKDKNGALWYATNIGIFLVRSRTGLNFKQIETTKKNSVRGIWGDEKGLRWVGAYSGAFYFPESGPPKFFPQFKAVWNFLPDGQGQFWLARESEKSPQRISLQNGKLSFDSVPLTGFTLNIIPFGNKLLAGGYLPKLSVLDRKSGKVRYQVPLKGKRNDYGQTMPAAKVILPQSDSSVWVAGNAGLFRLTMGKNGWLKQDFQAAPQEISSLPINALYQDNEGKLWVGTAGRGLFLFDPRSRKVKNFLAVDGLAHDIVYSILSSHSDSLLWLGTQKGLSCFNVAAASFHNYYEKDGLANNEFNTSATWKSPDGTLYLGGINGITYFKPQKPVLNESKAGVFLSLDVLDLRKEGVKARHFPISGDTFNLNPFNYYLDIGFQSSAHFDSEEIIYRFRISNRLTPSWQYLHFGEKLILNHLPTGTNRLVAQARMPAGNWGPVYTLNLRVFPPWYKTWQFISLLIAIILLFLYLLVRLRLRKYRREYNLRKKISADLHDEFGGRLFALNVLANQINAPATSGADFPKLFDQFQRLSLETLRTARNFIWAFDPGSDRLENLADRMEDFCSTVIRPLVPEITFQRGYLPHRRPINSKTKHYTLMIFQELLTNIVKHSDSESIHINFYVRDRYLVIKISNPYHKNRQNPLTGHHSSGNGLLNIHSRLSALNANIERKDNGQIYEATLTIKKW